MADRNAFLDRVRAAVARARAHHVSINPQATHEAAWVGGGPDPVATLLAEWIAVGGRGERVAGDDAARKFVGGYLRQNGITRILRWQHPLLERLGIDDVCRELGIAVAAWNDFELESPSQPWPTAFAADLGLTSVDWAVAETGTLALSSRPGQGRVASLLPPKYLAVVEPAQIVPDLFDLFARLEREKHDLPSNIALVTGPSKTGDIELKLTTGVHGPGDVTLLVVEAK